MRKTMLLGLTMVLAMVLNTAALAGAKVGQPAPQFTLQDHNGKDVSLSDFKGKIVVLEWFNNECPYVVKHYKEGHMNRLAGKYADKGVVWLAINSTSGKANSDNASIAKEWSMKHPILNDASGTVGKAYGATNTPHMYIVDKNGVLAYSGAIDSDRSADAAKVDGAENYVAKALDALLAGETVANAENKAYGCTVKYAK
jgi:peroxiredoxin